MPASFLSSFLLKNAIWMDSEWRDKFLVNKQNKCEKRWVGQFWKIKTAFSASQIWKYDIGWHVALP